MNVSIPTETLPSRPSDVVESFWVSNSSPFQGDSVCGSTSMVNFENSSRENDSGRTFFRTLDGEENGFDDYDRCSYQTEKKRRLSSDQVCFLERSFEVENKLEPERKVQLAKELGLQPRQVAIWFQNRRARYKTKQLEKDYDCLKASYDKLKTAYESLMKENGKLKNEVNVLTEKMLPCENGKLISEPCDPTRSLDAKLQKPIPDAVSQNVTSVEIVVCKHEDANSGKSDVFDSDSPRYTDGNHFLKLEPADSSHVLESDFSQDDSLSKSFLPPLCFPKFEVDGCYNYTDANFCNLEYPLEDQASWFWLSD